MIRRLPVLPTLIVLAAVGVMIALGFWQLDRMHQKKALLAQYAQAITLSSEASLPADAAQREKVWFRHATLECRADGTTRPMAGHNQQGDTGWAQWASCLSAEGKPLAEVNLGWTQAPSSVAFAGGTVSGVIAPDGPNGARVVAMQPLPGLQPSARPDPRDIPNNHFGYAMQWFFFATTALVIYVLAVRKRLAGSPPRG